MTFRGCLRPYLTETDKTCQIPAIKAETNVYLSPVAEAKLVIWKLSAMGQGRAGFRFWRLLGRYFIQQPGRLRLKKILTSATLESLSRPRRAAVFRTFFCILIRCRQWLCSHQLHQQRRFQKRRKSFSGNSKTNKGSLVALVYCTPCTLGIVCVQRLAECELRADTRRL